MEEKNNKKNIIFLVIALIIIVLIIASIAICISKKQNDITTQTKEAVEEQKDKTEEIVEKLQEEEGKEEKTSELKPQTGNEIYNITPEIKNFTNNLVYTAESENFESWGCIGTSSLPQINIDDEKINVINQQLKELYEQSKIYDIEDGIRLYMSYDAYLNGNILSLAVYLNYTANFGEENYIYNIDINTKEILSRNDILNFKNISENELNIKTDELITELKAKYKDEIEDLQITLNKPRINKYGLYNDEIFLDENCNINVSLKLGVAGSEDFANEYFYVK